MAMTPEQEIELIAKMAIDYAAKTECTERHAVKVATTILKEAVKAQQEESQARFGR